MRRQAYKIFLQVRKSNLAAKTIAASHARKKPGGFKSGDFFSPKSEENRGSFCFCVLFIIAFGALC